MQSQHQDVSQHTNEMSLQNYLWSWLINNLSWLVNIPQGYQPDNLVRLGELGLQQLMLFIAKQYDNSIDESKITQCHAIHLAKQTFVLCPMVKDAKTQTNVTTVPYLMDACKTYKTFCDSNNIQGATLFIPLFQCRGRGKIPFDANILGYQPFKNFKRLHAVLLEVDLQHAQITMHDPQAPDMTYPDKVAEVLLALNELFGLTFNYNPRYYGTQVDIDTCGEHVVMYWQSILAKGSALELATIKVEKASIKSNFDFARKLGVRLQSEPLKERVVSTHVDKDDDWTEIVYPQKTVPRGLSKDDMTPSASIKVESNLYRPRIGLLFSSDVSTIKHAAPNLEEVRRSPFCLRRSRVD